MRTVTGYSGQTIYGSGDNDVFSYAEGNGDVVIVSYGGEDTVSIDGAISQTSNNDNDVIFKVGNGSVTVKNAKGKYLNVIDANGLHASTVCGARYSYSPQDVIKSFMASLDKTTLYGKDAIDEAVRACSSFTSFDDLIAKMVEDCRNAESADVFLRDYCGIIIDNADTGAVTGWDMGGAVVKTAESIVQESGSFDDFSENSFTVRGLTVNLAEDFDSLTSDQQKIWRGLHTWWLEQGLQLIEESYGNNFSFESTGSATNKEMTVEFHPTLKNDWSASTFYNVNPSNGQNMETILKFSMQYFGSPNEHDINGSGNNSSASFYFDRTIAHELTHAIMNNNVLWTDKTPLQIDEGMAELTQGADDRRIDDFAALAIDADKLNNVFNGGDTSGIKSPAYSGGYMLLKYLSQQAASFDEAVITYNGSDGVNILGSSLDDSICNNGSRVTISTGADNDTIENYIAATYTLIDAGAGNDHVENTGAWTTITSGDGTDVLFNYSYASLTAIEAGDGADVIVNYASYTTLDGGKGSDIISIGGAAFGNVIEYAAGDGDDEIYGYNSSSTIRINDGASYSSLTSGSDVIINVGDGSMWLADAAGIDLNIVSGTYSGGSMPTGLTKDGTTLNVSTEYDGGVWLTGFDILNWTECYADLSAIEVNASNDGTNLRVIVGNEQSNVLRAGYNGAWLWGYLGEDTLFGGAGSDMYWFGKGEGNDVIEGCDDSDIVNLWSISLSEVMSFDVDYDDNITVGFSDGNRLKVNTTGSSTTFQLTDVGRWRYEHNSRSFHYIPS